MATLSLTAVPERPLTTSASPPLVTSPHLLTQIALTLAAATPGTVTLTPAA